MRQSAPLTKGGFKTLSGLHLAVAGGLTLFAIVDVIVVQQGIIKIGDESLDRIMQLIVIVAALASVLSGFQLFKKRILKIRNDNAPAGEKIARYRSACITWWAMIDFPALLALACFMVTGNYAFFAVAIFLLLILLLFRPRKENVVLLLNLSAQEVERENF